MSASIDRMLDAALLVSATVPATLQLVQVAAGRADAFWQKGQVRSGLAAGALLVQEAHGVIVDSTGAPWTLTGRDLVASTPGLVEAVLDTLTR